MIREDLVIDQTRKRLDEFLAPMQSRVGKPLQRFLTPAVRDIL